MKAYAPYKMTAAAAALAAVFALNAFAVNADAQSAPRPPQQISPVGSQQSPGNDATMPAAPAVSQAKSSAAVNAESTTPTAIQGNANLQPGSVDAAAVSSAEPKDFMRKAFLANEFGIAASQVALAQSKSPATKKAAQKILSDGMKERQDMIAAIQKATSDMHFDQSWDDKYKQMLADLKAAPEGKAFDSKYAELQGTVSDQTASLFSQYAQNGTDTSVKTFAAATLPTIQADDSQLKATGG
jgi:putative membrane protein